MDSRNVALDGTASQQFQPNSGSPLDSLIHDLRRLRDDRIGKDRHRRSAILVGQVLILALEYKTGRSLNKRTLKRFFHFVAREQAL